MASSDLIATRRYVHVLCGALLTDNCDWKIAKIRSFIINAHELLYAVSTYQLRGDAITNTYTYNVWSGTTPARFSEFLE